ncbi:hypothetical protein AB0H76_01360 [Nocardia sp. NPDC050712]|uniref:hypothetical protein n=1 Tax=Nocardia sp. NPDC050712 TaxID=3155518 RepID=UPI00340DC681
MGVIGELFPGQKLADEGGEDSNGQPHRPVELDLDAGVVRLAPPPRRDESAAAPDEE